MNFLFRVDAGGRIGLGHFYRSLNLAEQLKRRGHTVLFIFRESDFWNKKMAEPFNFEGVCLNQQHYEEEVMLNTITGNNIQVFYVDGVIEFSNDFINEVKKKAKVVFYQNVSESAHLADIFILPSLHHKDNFFDDFKPETQVYKGLSYFTFNSKITNIKKNNQKQEIKSVAVTAGGSDPNDTLRRLYKMVNYSLFPNIQFKYYYGIDYLYIDDIPKEPNENSSFELFDHQNIVENDLLISAFGVSTYEFLALGMPIISFGHQMSNAYAAEFLAQKTEALMSLGNFDDITEQALNTSIELLIKDKAKRSALVKNAVSILDFKGIDRIIEILEHIPYE